MNEKYTTRDYLAQDRTHLANERTLLAYWRTALTFLVLGAVLIKFFPLTHLIVGGLASIFLGIVLFLYGTIRYFSWRRRINSK